LLELMEAGIVFPITDVGCQYKASAKFDDYISIETTLIELSRAKMVFSYRVIREADGKLLAEGRTQNVFTDNQGRIIRLEPQVLEKLDRMYRQELR